MTDTQKTQKRRREPIQALETLEPLPKRRRVQPNSNTKPVRKPKQQRKGSGVPLGDIPQIVANLKGITSTSPFISKLHLLLYSKKCQWRKAKTSILKFSGFKPYVKSEAIERKRLFDKLNNWTKSELQILCKLLDLKVPNKKVDFVETIVQFLETPKPMRSSDQVLMPSKKRAPVSSAKRKPKKKQNFGKTPPKNPRNPYHFYIQQKKLFNEPNDMKKLVSEWRMLSEEEKQPYKKQAEEDKKRYDRDFSEYVKWTVENGRQIKLEESPNSTTDSEEEEIKIHNLNPNPHPKSDFKSSHSTESEPNASPSNSDFETSSKKSKDLRNSPSSGRINIVASSFEKINMEKAKKIRNATWSSSNKSSTLPEISKKESSMPSKKLVRDKLKQILRDGSKLNLSDLKNLLSNHFGRDMEEWKDYWMAEAIKIMSAQLDNKSDEDEY